jgi:hypothetical protein
MTEGKYDDIIRLPHPDSISHLRMSAMNRAAQFSPFAALTGYGDAVEETARLTEENPELDEDAREELDRKLKAVSAHLENRPRIRLEYFAADEKKEGGSFKTAEGIVKKIDGNGRKILMEDGTAVFMEDIVGIEILSL